MNADVLKLARDGQLAYGRPDPVTTRLRECAAKGHGGSVEYADGTHRCLTCLQDFIPRRTLSDREAKA